MKYHVDGPPFVASKAEQGKPFQEDDFSPERNNRVEVETTKWMFAAGDIQLKEPEKKKS